MSPAIASTWDFSWEEDLSEDLRLFDEEWEKSGVSADDDLSISLSFDFVVVVYLVALIVCYFFQGFDIDFSKLRHKFETGAVDLDDDDLVLDPDDTNVGLLSRLSNLAISYYNDKTVSYILIKIKI